MDNKNSDSTPLVLYDASDTSQVRKWADDPLVQRQTLPKKRRMAALYAEWQDVQRQIERDTSERERERLARMGPVERWINQKVYEPLGFILAELTRWL